MFDTPLDVQDDETEVSKALANFVTKKYLDAVEERGCFSIALTGGRALALLSCTIAAEPFVSFVDWRKWFVFILEDRCCPLTSPCSSYRLVDEQFLQFVRIPELQVFPAYDEEVRLDALDHKCEPAAALYEQRVRAALGVPTDELPAIDVVLAGCGPDGAFGCFFPGHPAAENAVHNLVPSWGATGATRPLAPAQAVAALYECPPALPDVALDDAARTAIARVGGVTPERVGLSLRAVNNAREICVPLTGQDIAPVRAPPAHPPLPPPQPPQAHAGRFGRSL